MPEPGRKSKDDARLRPWYDDSILLMSEGDAVAEAKRQLAELDADGAEDAEPTD